jgi:hypothetical protein
VSGVFPFFGVFWLIMLENPAFEGNPDQKDTPEVVELQEPKL